VLLYPSEQVAMVVTVPVLLTIGYWLVRRRTALDQVPLDEPVLAVAPTPVLDTERGRMA
jgi:hypothetical protein